MRTILVDDEEWGLKRFQMECEHIEDVELLGSFTNPLKAIEFVAANRVELAFLDVEMPEMNGLELAGRLRELIPEIIIIFVSAYDSYMAEAFRSKKADYYVMKPYSSEDIEDAVSRARLLSGRLSNVITAKTFGHFRLSVNGEEFHFADEKNKELLALLINLNGEAASYDEIADALWTDYPGLSAAEKKLWCRRQVNNLKTELDKVSMSSAIEEDNRKYFLHKDVLDCDYYRFMKLDENIVQGYQDNYLMDYSWAEQTRIVLKRIQEEFLLQTDDDRKKASLEQEYEKLTLDCKALEKRCAILKTSEETYRTALGMTTHTVTLVDIPNKSLCQIFNEGKWSGVQTTMPNAPESIIATGIINQDDVEAYREFYRRIYAGSPAEECSIRTLSENGHWFWFTMYTQTIFDEEGKPKYAICFSDDMTAQHEAELMYQQFVQIIISDAEYSWEANISQDKMLREDIRSRHLLGSGSHTFFSELNETFFRHVVLEDREQVREKCERISMLQAYYDGKREIHNECRYQLPNSNKIIWIENITYLLMDENEDIHAIMTARDITNIKLREEQEENQSSNDPLCNINRRDTFDEKVRRKIDNKKSGSLFMIDVDGFKGVNDNYGHLFGDKVLIDISQAITRNFRAEDNVARYGGDEFVVFMQGNYSEKVLKAAATSLLNRVRNLQYENGYAASISIGAAQLNQGENLDAMYRRADNALYQAKEKGKNTFCIG